MFPCAARSVNPGLGGRATVRLGLWVTWPLGDLLTQRLGNAATWQRSDRPAVSTGSHFMGQVGPLWRVLNTQNTNQISAKGAKAVRELADGGFLSTPVGR